MCEDKKYKARKLQQHDKTLFRYRGTSRIQTHARTCQHEYQPNVLSYNPEENEKIDRRSFTKVMKYCSSPDNQNYYIWCLGI